MPEDCWRRLDFRKQKHNRDYWNEAHIGQKSGQKNRNHAASKRNYNFVNLNQA